MTPGPRRGRVVTFALVTAIGALLAASCGSGGEGAGVSDDVEPELAAAADAVLDELSPDEPGCSAAVGEAGDPVWTGQRGLARLEPAVPIEAATVFDIASTSKQFTATAVLLLEDDGELDLEAPLNEVVPGLADWAGDVTVRHLLFHQAGIPEYADLMDVDYDEPATVADAVAALGGVDGLHFDPGSEFEYSNSGYFLLSLVVEEVAGVTLADFLDDRVFGPLGLDAVMDPVADISEKATSYELVDGDYAVADSLWEQTGDGGVQTTPTELVRWAKEYWDPEVGGEEVLLARTEDAVDDGEGGLYGAGISFSEDDDPLILSHAGTWAGFVTDLFVVPEEEVAVAVSCNSTEHDPTAIAEELLALWLD